MQEKELGMYNPDASKTSKHLSCSDELCSLGGSCRSSKQPCPYTVNYYSENTSTSGLLVEDTMYLAKSDDHVSIKAPVILGWVVAMRIYFVKNSSDDTYLVFILNQGFFFLSQNQVRQKTEWWLFRWYSS